MKKIALVSAAVLMMGTSAVMAQNKPQAVVAVETAPGVLKVAEGVQFQGKFKSVDPKTREVVIVGPNGNEYKTVLGDEVRNFNQIKVGDIVTLTHVEILVADIKKPSKVEIRERVETEKAARAKLGDKPAAAIERQVTVVADVTAVDEKKGTITLRGATRTLDLKVKDPKVLKGVKVGTQVEATVTEIIAIEVTAPKK
ncbi:MULTISPECIES: hypothetical protein [unclassified Polynucleobacter]|jgi:hypothetical protein|uniref:hypothetical protein n=1 Tax=unclassified Polynucleobacter TaxID=2640945 RepID=UPI00257345E4|nr:MULTISPECIES: hypothetical protein [unclassified Polynucleobacter]BEI35369.1 hypothetical protein PHIN6_08870 [Polynucleobacter sp. HIN6]BEI37169.1 hypothetical protein PHIN7_08930 [Polynucleobacter sp. HIN7]BEI40951.1 hypothetical protein PHIN9_08820 [Polynucleobacter sp. HIN9]